MQSAGVPLVPLVFDPVYQQYLWGGDRIPKGFNRPLPDGRWAESWEISDRPEGAGPATGGPWAGATLGELVSRLGTRLLGSAVASSPGVAPAFPLLIKLIDARERLSVQVHPDDAAAALCGGEAKTEAWHILEAAPGAQVFAGLRPGTTEASFRAALAASRLEECLRAIPVRAGDTIYIPGGRVHAICEGCLLLEVQQNSNTTYRVYDWGRVGTDGKPRELHIDQALRVIRWDDAGEPRTIPRATVGDDGVASLELVTSPYFRLERLALGGPLTCRNDGRSFHALFASEVALDIEHADGRVEVPFGRSCLIPAGLAGYRLIPRAPGQVLRTSVP